MPKGHRKDIRHLSRTQLHHGSLSIGDRRFVEEYLLDCDPKQAAIRAGLLEVEGPKLLSQPRIQLAIQREAGKRSTRTEVYADEVLRRWWLLATADVRELVQLRRVCCRHCYGIDHRYQYTKDELRRAVQSHQQMLLKRDVPQEKWLEFDDLGGDGYDGKRAPAEDCTECFGEGLPSVWLEDSRNYSAAAAVLFDGVKLSKDGSVELKMRDRTDALNKVAQHLGMLVQRQAILTIDPTQLTDDQLDAALKQFARLDGNAIEASEIDHEGATDVDEDEDEVTDQVIESNDEI